MSHTARTIALLSVLAQAAMLWVGPGHPRRGPERPSSCASCCPATGEGDDHADRHHVDGHHVDEAVPRRGTASPASDARREGDPDRPARPGHDPIRCVHCRLIGLLHSQVSPGAIGGPALALTPAPQPDRTRCSDHEAPRPRPSRRSTHPRDPPLAG